VNDVVTDGIVIRRALPDPRVTRELADVLVDCVEGGATVGFMLPIDHAGAEAFWTDTLDSAARGERIVLVAEESRTGTIVGTVQVVLRAPANQPHRGAIAKLLVHRHARRRGIAEALMRAAEGAALEAGTTLLVFDTAGAEGERLYHRTGWHRVGVIPDNELAPNGRLVDATIFYKRIRGPE
jgi:GNAT superfamily N-acetyltransferase